MNMPISRYGWKGLEIRPVFGMKIADGTYEDVPLGVFTVETAEWTASGVVIKAYDHMALLDKNCNKVITEVTPYQCAQAIAEATGVNFANTEKEFESFANGTTMISETTTNDVETWRDLVSWLAQTIGCFATADREGNIVFRSFDQTVVDTIDDAHRFTGGSFSDYVTRYTGLSVVNMEDSTTSYYAEDEDDGLTMNLGSNPFLQYGVAATKEEMAKAILTAIQQIRYVPFTCRAIGNPAYDLGDVLVFQNGSLPIPMRTSWSITGSQIRRWWKSGMESGSRWHLSGLLQRRKPRRSPSGQSCCSIQNSASHTQSEARN